MSLPDVLEAGRVVYVTGAIDEDMSEARRQVRQLALADPEKKIVLVINSPGGDGLGGFALLDELELVRQQTTVTIEGVVQGLAASAALSLLCGCDRRIAGSHSVLMAHGSWTRMSGDVRDRRAEERLVTILHERMARLYAARTEPAGGLSYDAWLTRFEDDRPWYLTPTEALQQGLVDEVLGG